MTTQLKTIKTPAIDFIQAPDGSQPPYPQHGAGMPYPGYPPAQYPPQGVFPPSLGMPMNTPMYMPQPYGGMAPAPYPPYGGAPGYPPAGGPGYPGGPPPAGPGYPGGPPPAGPGYPGAPPPTGAPGYLPPHVGDGGYQPPVGNVHNPPSVSHEIKVRLLITRHSNIYILYLGKTCCPKCDR